MIGVDPDPKALARARTKAAQAGLEVTFDEAFGGDLPYADGSFDRVVSSLVLHHLKRDEKLEALRDVHRVLASDGALHVLDVGAAADRIRARTRASLSLQRARAGQRGQTAPGNRSPGGLRRRARNRAPVVADRRRHADHGFAPVRFRHAALRRPVMPDLGLKLRATLVEWARVPIEPRKGGDRADGRAPIWVFGALYVVLFGAVILLWFRVPPIRR